MAQLNLEIVLGKSPVCQNSGVGKKGEMLGSCQQRQQRRKKQISGQKKSFQPMLLARLARRTREHQPERIACLGIESSGSRTHDLLLRRDAHRFPFRELHCPVMPDFPAFPADFYVFDGGQRNVKNRNFQPCCQTSVRYANKGGSPLRQRRNLLDENAYIIITKWK